MITESDMLNETIRTQQAEIERLKGQRDRLLDMLKTIDMKYAFGDCEPVQELIAEIEAEND